MRIQHHPIVTISHKKQITFYFNEHKYTGLDGDSIATALWANNVTTLRHTEKNNMGRSLFCGIGNCFDCRVYIKNQGMVRACNVPIVEGLEVFSTDRGIE
ncbi:(2Fe-2S)-binding protein [Lysinibacillus sp. RC79]|uniref:(2Fe-2S)-binding protein n=1 Tax=Lysinibacillus sp. RC79 TaxID=3156296 RepID=UPI00351741BB